MSPLTTGTLLKFTPITLFISFVLVVSILFLASPHTSFAIDPVNPASCQGEAANSQFCKNVQTESGRRLTGPGGFLTIVAQTVVFVVGAVSVIMIIIGGLRYVLSGGDTAGVAGAKNTILYALVGLGVAIFSQAIVTFVLSRFQ